MALGRIFDRADFRANPIRALWRRFWWRVRWRLTSQPLVAALGNGLSIALPRSSSAAPLYYAGWSEPDVAAFLDRLLRPGDVMLDVGAHVGEYTLLAAARGATVHAFEPNAASAALLRANVDRNALSGVTVHECAVSDRDGEARFLAHRDPSLSALSDSAEATVRTVRLESLDLPRVDVVKIDVEGGELAVLRGARGLLNRHAPAVVFEFAPVNYARFGSEARDIFGFFETAGYRVTRLDGTPFDSLAPGLWMVNLVASKRPIA